MQEHSTKEAIKASTNPNERLKNERERRGWTRDYVAEKIGSDTKSVGRWERGAIFPSPYYRQKLCELFGMNAEELGFIKEEVKDSVEPHPIREVPPLPVGETNRANGANGATGSKRDFAEKSKSRQFIPGYRGLFASIAIASVIVVIVSLLLTLFSWRLLMPVVSSNSPNSPAQTPIITSQIKPGGTWISPSNGSIVHDTIHFEAKAYPTNHGDPAINHVNFTIGWSGAWRIACTVFPPAGLDNIYTCNVNLSSLGAPSGPIKVSFDVYDQQGNSNLAPNGVHTLYYQP